MDVTPRTAALNNAEVALNHVGEPAARYTALALVYAAVHIGDQLGRLADRLLSGEGVMPEFPTIGSTWKNRHSGEVVKVTAIDGNVVVCDAAGKRRTIDLWITHWTPIDGASDAPS